VRVTRDLGLVARGCVIWGEVAGGDSTGDYFASGRVVDVDVDGAVGRVQVRGSIVSPVFRRRE